MAIPDTSTVLDRIHTLTDPAIGGVSGLYDTMQTTQVPLISAFGLFGVFVIIFLVSELLKRKTSVRKKGTAQMDPNARKTRVREMIRDAFVESLWNLRHRGEDITGDKLSENEYRVALAQLRQDMGFNVPWVIRHRLHPKALQAELKRFKADLIQRRKAEGKPLSLAENGNSSTSSKFSGINIKAA